MAIDFGLRTAARRLKAGIILTEAESPASYAAAVAQRAGAIFAPYTRGDPMQVGLNEEALISNKYFKGAPVVEPFRLVPAEFLARGYANAPESPQNTVSAFANWVYSLYGMPGTEADADRGLAAEPLIFEARRRPKVEPRSVLSACDSAVLAQHWPEWELVHCGLHLDADPNELPPFFKIDHLPVSGRPLHASPDLIYRNVMTGEIIIVECKTSRQGLPPNLWPNVWAQLWCYANIPLVRDAPKVTVIGEVWGELYKRGQRYLCLRASVRRDPRARSYDSFFRSLFDIYSGAPSWWDHRTL